MFKNLSAVIAQLAEAISLFVAELKASREQRKLELEWLKSQFQLATKRDLERWVEDMAKTQAELAADLRGVFEQQKKTIGEIQNLQTTVDDLKTKITDLETQIANGPAVSDELQAAVEAVKAQAQIVDDAIPDLPVPPPAPEG